MAHCPAYSGPICSLCCSLETRCKDFCKPDARISRQFFGFVEKSLPGWIIRPLNSDIAHFLGVFSLFAGVIGTVLLFVYFQVSFDSVVNKAVLKSTLWTVFFILAIIAGIAAWLFVLAHESRRVAEEESRRQTDLLIREIEAHKRTDAKLQRAKEVAEAASHAKSRYVVGLSHELRTPLNAILGYAQILERDPEMPPRRIDGIRVVRRSAEHLSGLIDGLLDISKIEAGRFHLNRNEVRLPEFIEQLVDMFQLQAAAKGIAFHFVATSRLPTVVHTDENRLRQILINLLSNAIKFTDSGHVTLRAHYRSQVAEFEIEDTGIGIDAEDLERIFRPFERACSARARNTSGTGLGLTITKLLTATMGGELTVTSAVNKGTTFRVKLLLSEVARPRTAPTVESAVRGYIGERQTILVVDDNEIQRELIRELLAPLGFAVFAAASGPECLAIAERHKPNLVLLDVLMPGMDGWEVARRLRHSAAERPVIVMLSANTVDKDDTAEPPRIYDGYIMKPVELRQLLETIHALLNIEWTYEPDAPPSPPRTRSEPPSTLTPPARDIAELIHFAQIGYVRGIQNKLTEIEANAPVFRGFVAHMRQIANEFDMKRLMSALESCRRNHV
jgi:signal transduction histidine kinase/DNA-binding NarL/FixJ family response regulator